MNNRTIMIILIAILLIVVVAVAVFAMRSGDGGAVVPPGPDGGNSGAVAAYDNKTFGISFTYPAEYEITEREVGTAERRHYSIVLTLPEEPIDPNIPREGPTAITVDVYQNDLDRLALIDWVTTTNDSNYKIAIGPYASTTVAGREAIKYTWDGLYRGDTVAFEHGGDVVAVSVTYLTPEDQIRADYQDLLSSLRLQNPASETP